MIDIKEVQGLLILDVQLEEEKEEDHLHHFHQSVVGIDQDQKIQVLSIQEIVVGGEMNR